MIQKPKWNQANPKHQIVLLMWAFHLLHITLFGLAQSMCSLRTQWLHLWDIYSNLKPNRPTQSSRSCFPAIPPFTNLRHTLVWHVAAENPTRRRRSRPPQPAFQTRLFGLSSLSRTILIPSNPFSKLNFHFISRSINQPVRSTRYSASASSSRTRPTGSKSSPTTLTAGPRSLSRHTSLATMELAPLSSCQLQRRLRRIKGLRWMDWRFVTICIGWEAVAISPSMVCT